jgi:hypothetical protein
MQLIADHYRKNARKRRSLLEVRCCHEVADIIDGRRAAIGTIEAHIRPLAPLIAPQRAGDIYKNAANELSWVRHSRGRM